MNKKYEWTVNRVLDTLNKYPNHKILSITPMNNKLCFKIEYISEKYNSKTITYVDIYADGENE